MQFGADEQLADINPNDAMVQKYFEESKGWIEQGDVRQPKVDVQQELNKLNFCKFNELKIIGQNFSKETPIAISSRSFSKKRMHGKIHGQLNPVNWVV